MIIMFPVDNIRKACADNGTSIAALERALKIGNGVIARWETQKGSPPYEKLLQIAAYLNTTVDALTGGDIKDAAKEKAARERLTAMQEAVINLLPRLTADDLKLLLTVAKAQIAARQSRDSE